MKKFISVFLAVIMSFVMFVPAFSVDINTRDSTNIECINTTEVKSKLESLYDLIHEFFAKMIEFIMSLFEPKEEPDGNYYYIYFHTGEYYQGGSPVKISEKEIMSGEPIDIEIPSPEKYGYKFIGWEPEIPKTMPNHDIIFVAQWEQLEGFSTIYVDLPDDAYIPEMAWIKGELTQEIGTEVKLPEAPIRTSYVFKGWSPDFPSTMPEENITITALWEKNTDIEINWMLRDEEGEWVKITHYYNYGDEISSPLFVTGPWPLFVKDGFEYYFNGWSPELQETATKNVTYVAQYTARPIKVS